jgi:hypothetical protein
MIILTIIVIESLIFTAYYISLFYKRSQLKDGGVRRLIDQALHLISDREHAKLNRVLEKKRPKKTLLMVRLIHALSPYFPFSSGC